MKWLHVTLSAKSRHWWVCTLALCALALPYSTVLPRLFRQWLQDPEMAHAILVAPVIAAFLYARRAMLAELEPRPSYIAGVPLLGLGWLLFAASLAGAGLFAGALGFLVSACGAVMLTLGPRVFAAMAGPLSLSVFLLPRLAMLYDPLTNPLAQLSATLATSALRPLGVAAENSGSLVTVSGYPILVGESCSGLRFLIPLLFVAAALVLAAGPRIRWRAAVALMAAALPLAVLANAARVGILVYLAGSRQGAVPAAAHDWLGYPLYAAALAGLLVAARFAEESRPTGVATS
ncbi:MAG: exosortase [Bryobacterales bacterium]|nr:exosortase [Bryobacterales bacterium]